MLSRMAERQRPTSKKNGRIMMAQCLNTSGVPRSEIPHAPHLFKMKCALPPQLQNSGEAGLSSVPHGKLLATFK